MSLFPLNTLDHAQPIMGNVNFVAELVSLQESLLVIFTLVCFRLFENF